MLTHVRGTRNAHLADPQGFDDLTRKHSERTTPLPLDGEVRGDFVTLDYCGHCTCVIIEDHDSLADVELKILSGAGILNPFTEVVLAFINGKLREYEVRHESGTLLAKAGVLVVSWSEVRGLSATDRRKCQVLWMTT